VEISLLDYYLITYWLLWQEANRLSDYILGHPLAPLSKERISLLDRILDYLSASMARSKSSISLHA
jgi:hypothetical protein